jgi:hypothetical protein
MSVAIDRLPQYFRFSSAVVSRMKRLNVLALGVDL